MTTYEFKVGDVVEYVGNTKGLSMNKALLGEVFTIKSIRNEWIENTDCRNYRNHNLALASKPYDPNQIGDLDDDL